MSDGSLVREAIILAGGRGSRLAPWPAPKVLLPIAGVPILERLLMHLVSQGIIRVIVCTGYRAKDVEAAVRWRAEPRAEILFSNAGQDAAMGARLLRAKDLCGGGRLLVTYGDELADVDIEALACAHASERASITYTVWRHRLPFGVVVDGHIRDDEQVLINIGFALVEPRAWPSLRPEDGLATWMNRENARPYLHQGRRSTVNSLAELQSAEEVWRLS